MLLANGNVDGSWGQDARALCDGAATNDSRFGIGFIDGKGGVWWVHGPVGADAAGEPLRVAPLASNGWCALASAGDRIAIAWRDRNRLLFNTCTPTKCSALPATIKLSPARDVV
jgi:hypothetical protein